MDAKSILAFIEEIGRMKLLPRTGWLLRGIKHGESIADHCFRMSILSMVMADALAEQGVDIDTEKVMRIALLHEIAEARLTDIPYPAQKYIPEDVKEDAERAAIDDMLTGFGPLKERYTALWQEFEQASTLEGRLVRAIDKLEMMVQVAEYERAGYSNLNDFWMHDWNRRFFNTHPLIAEVFDWLVAQQDTPRSAFR